MSIEGPRVEKSQKKGDINNLGLLFSQASEARRPLGGVWASKSGRVPLKDSESGLEPLLEGA